MHKTFLMDAQKLKVENIVPKDLCHEKFPLEN